MVPSSVEEQIGSIEEYLTISLDLGPGNILTLMFLLPFLYSLSSLPCSYLLSHFLFPPTPPRIAIFFLKELHVAPRQK